MTVHDTIERSLRSGHSPRATHMPAMVVPEVPPLENGDHLTREEFERRYEAMPHIKKAELIEGIVYMPSPIRYGSHSKPQGQIITWLGIYCTATPGVDLGGNATVRLDPINEPQPDALLRLDTSLGGRSRISPDDYVEGASELVVEIAASSALYDLHDKLTVYCRNRVQEYIVWQVYDNRLDWFVWSDGEYIPLVPDAEGIIRSRIFPGLHLSAVALLKGDLAGVLAMLQHGLETDEHRAFVKHLEEMRRKHLAVEGENQRMEA